MEMQRVWEKYMNENIIDSSKVNQIIIDSWNLCKKLKVNPHKGTGSRLLATSDFHKRLNEHETMISLARNSLKRFQYLLKNMEFILVLADADGYILWQSGNEKLQERARKIKFSQGYQWTESMVGTNSIGVSLRTKKAQFIRGYEHFAKASHNWGCVASPIFGENQEVIGVVDISMPAHYPKKDELLFIVQLIADFISETLQKKALEDQKYMLQYFSKRKQPGILCNTSMTILHISPDLINEPESYIGENLNDLAKNKWKIKKQEPIIKNNKCIGYCVQILKPKEANHNFTFRYVSGRSKVFHELLEEIKIVAPTLAPIHLYGETGSGKEIIAKTIHENSHFAKGKLVSINCGGIPENLMESELFGYEKGAFTGANPNGHAGKIEQANNGTLFLDEIEDMSLSMQSDLLRVLQEKKLTRIGGHKEIEVNFRLITASNQDLKVLVKERKFREDLFYRIYVCPIQIPPLRERREDIQEFIKAFERANDWYPFWERELVEVAEQYSWMGNIRELNNFLERCYIYYNNQEPSREQLVELIYKGSLMEYSEFGDSLSIREKIEKDNILQVLIENNGNIPNAAKQLSISKSTLYRKMKKYKLN